MSNLILIGLAANRPSSGKTTVAQALMHRAGFVRLPLADPLKRIGTAILTEAGVSEIEARRYLYHDRQAVIPLLNVTGRHLLQTLGTDWGRRCISKRIWTNLWRRSFEDIARAANCRGTLQGVVVDDVRFRDEADLICRLGGQMWMIERPRSQQESRQELRRRLRPSLLLRPWKLLMPQHASEGGLKHYRQFDVRIRNDGTIHELLQQTWHYAGQLGIKPAGLGPFDAVDADPEAPCPVKSNGACSLRPQPDEPA